VKFCIKLRHFLSADNENEIEAILSNHESHFLHEYIDGDKPLYPIIDFDLPVETLNAIFPKLSGKQVKNLLCCIFKDTCIKNFSKMGIKKPYLLPIVVMRKKYLYMF
jgi:hypothetical protein